MRSWHIIYILDLHTKTCVSELCATLEVVQEVVNSYGTPPTTTPASQAVAQPGFGFAIWTSVQQVQGKYCRLLMQRYASSTRQQTSLNCCIPVFFVFLFIVLLVFPGFYLFIVIFVFRTHWLWHYRYVCTLHPSLAPVELIRIISSSIKTQEMSGY